MERLFWISIAGALGTASRYLIGLWSAQRLGTTYPYGTLIVNVLGCFLIALVMRVAVAMAAFPATLRLVITTGFLGGLTTYSSFNFETTKLFLDGRRGVALLNLGTTVGGCFVAGLLGLLLAERMTGQ